MTAPIAPPADRLFALIASIPGSSTVNWCDEARALLDEITAAVPVSSPPADRAAELDRLRTENERMRHELQVMYGGAFDSMPSEPADRDAVLTAAERKFLTFALDLAFDRMVSDDGFTDEDEAALDSLRRMADETRPALCVECGHPCAVHREGDDPVTPGECTACPDDERHDYRPALTPPPA